MFSIFTCEDIVDSFYKKGALIDHSRVHREMTYMSISAGPHVVRQNMHVQVLGRILFRLLISISGTRLISSLLLCSLNIR